MKSVHGHPLRQSQLGQAESRRRWDLPETAAGRAFPQKAGVLAPAPPIRRECRTDRPPMSASRSRWVRDDRPRCRRRDTSPASLATADHPGRLMTAKRVVTGRRMIFHVDASSFESTCSGASAWPVPATAGKPGCHRRSTRSAIGAAHRLRSIRLHVKRVQLAGAAPLEQKNNRLGAVA